MVPHFAKATKGISCFKPFSQPTCVSLEHMKELKLLREAVRRVTGLEASTWQSRTRASSAAAVTSRM
jgi:hypothetical protein